MKLKIEACARYTYALRILRAHGLAGKALHAVFNATVMAKMLYCSPAWSGFCLAKDREQIDVFIRRCKRMGLCDSETPSAVELFGKADDALFEKVKSDEHHVLYPLIPGRIEHKYNMRHRRHNRNLVTKTTTLSENNFIIRMLYKNIY